MVRLAAVALIILVQFAAASPVHAAPATLGDLARVIENIIKLLVPAAAIAFLFMLILGSYKFITSGGDPKNTASARTVLFYAILGIILVVAAWLILQLIKAVTGVDTTKVSIQ